MDQLELPYNPPRRVKQPPIFYLERHSCGCPANKEYIDLSDDVAFWVVCFDCGFIIDGGMKGHN